MKNEMSRGYDCRLIDYDSCVDELGAACDASELSVVEDAVVGIASSAQRLLAAFEQARENLPPNKHLDRNALSLNIERSEEACESIQEILKETPSDGEELEKHLEKAIEVAETLYDELVDLWNED